jgi:hypothetical protein
MTYASVESDREFARNHGMDNPHLAWISAPSDAWYPNPFYKGPPVRHPEDDLVDMNDFVGPFWRYPDDEIPF